MLAVLARRSTRCRARDRHVERIRSDIVREKRIFTPAIRAKTSVVSRDTAVRGSSVRTNNLHDASYSRRVEREASSGTRARREEEPQEEEEGNDGRYVGLSSGIRRLLINGPS